MNDYVTKRMNDVCQIYGLALEATGCKTDEGDIRDGWKRRPEMFLQAMLIEAVHDLANQVRELRIQSS